MTAIDLLQEFIHFSPYYVDYETGGWDGQGYRCNYCTQYFLSQNEKGRDMPHADNCLVKRSQDFIAETKEAV